MLVSPKTGEPFQSDSEPDKYEYVLSPKILVEYKKSMETYATVEKTAAELGLNLAAHVAAASESIGKLNVAREEYNRTRNRVIKSTGIHESQVTGIDPERGTLVYSKKGHPVT